MKPPPEKRPELSLRVQRSKLILNHTMSPNARFYIFAGLLVILILFVALALSGSLSFVERPFVVRGFEAK